MNSFITLSPLARSAFALWALLLCLICIGSGMLSVVKKRFRLTLFALVLFVPSFVLWQIVFDYSLFFKTGTFSRLTQTAGSVSWINWLVCLVLLTAFSAILFWFNIKYDKTYITPGAIKLYLDKMPCGVCCWRENGRVLFSNICMNELCVAITKSALLNGNQFCDAVKDGIKSVDGKVWRFSSREITVDGETLYEMIASDITAEYSKTEALERDKTELSRLNSELREYYMSIDESVKRQEILQAKMNIHDEMNRLMLSTVAADSDDSQALDRIFSLWEQNALLLCMETDSNANVQQADALDSLAKALGIEIVRDEDLPDILNEKQKELFFFTAQEALINAVKHAQAKRLEISFERTDGSLVCRFSNDGKLPEGEVHFEGGLANIRLLAEKQNASVYTEIGEKFTLVLKYQPNG
jgi:hypothetical protein